MMRKMMKNNRKSGFTLVELLVVVSIIAIMVAIALPTLPGMIRSQKMSSSQTAIKAILANAQVRAATSQKYAGVRFQASPQGRFYAVHLEQATQTNRDIDGNGSVDIDFYYIGSGGWESFLPMVPVPNSKPIALPEGMAMMSIDIDNSTIPDDMLINYDQSAPQFYCLENFETFTIVFSPSGQIVTKKVGVLWRNDNDAIFGPAIDTITADGQKSVRLLSYDNFLMVPSNVNNNENEPWCWPEDSTTGLYLYEKDALTETDPDLRYTDIISQHKSNLSVQQMVFNVYTGAVIRVD
ncbi:MAG: prepilin-type N-terminal cleavage/methylation domain-containing protein [Phycisphaerae bacterium]|nr:prepilin-type N-terminal cleavage/methylation domain-containing protein [Phycisphaerae bacterium]